MGKQGGFAVLSKETSYRYGVEQSFRASFGTTSDYYSVHDAPGYVDRTGVRQSGLTSEFRWQFSEHDSAPIGLTCRLLRPGGASTIQPQGRGRPICCRLVCWPITCFIPNRLYAAVNATITPTFSAVAALWQSAQPFELSAALAGALGDRIFLGDEVRWAAQKLTPFGDGAVYIGPSLYVKLQENLTVKAAWSAQAPGLLTGRLNIGSYERHQILFQFAYGR